MRKLFEEYPQYDAHSDGYLIRTVTKRGCKPSRIVKGAKRSDGYMQVFRMKPFNLMHQIIAHVFLGKVPEGYEVNHKDGNRSNNCIDNLEYVTRSRNVKHGYEIGSEESLLKRKLAAIQNGLRSKDPKIAAKISKSKISCKVLCVDTGVIFESAKQAADWCRTEKLTTSENAAQMIHYAFKTGCKSYGFTWQKLEKDEVE